MLGVLMAAAQGRARTGPPEATSADMVRGSLVMRLRGPRGGWPLTLAAFALVAPLFLVLTDILQVAFPYWESRAAVHRHISPLRARGNAADIRLLLAWRRTSAACLLSQPAFLVLVVGRLIARRPGRQRIASTARRPWYRAAADATQWSCLTCSSRGGHDGGQNEVSLVLARLARPGSVGRRREGWQHTGPVLVLANATQSGPCVRCLHDLRERGLRSPQETRSWLWDSY